MADGYVGDKVPVRMYAHVRVCSCGRAVDELSVTYIRTQQNTHRLEINGADIDVPVLINFVLASHPMLAYHSCYDT